MSLEPTNQLTAGFCTRRSLKGVAAEDVVALMSCNKLERVTNGDQRKDGEQDKGIRSLCSLKSDQTTQMDAKISKIHHKPALMYTAPAGGRSTGPQFTVHIPTHDVKARGLCQKRCLL